MRNKKLHGHILAWRRIDMQDAKNLMNSISNRRRLKTKSRLVSCLCRDPWNNRQRNLFDSGAKRLRNYDLDITRIVKGLKSAKNLEKTMLTKRQQLLLKYQKRDIIATDDSPSDSDADMAKLQSKNPFLRLMAMSKLKHIVNQFLQEEINEVDSRLLHGIYQDEVLTQKELKPEYRFIIDRISVAKEQARE